MLQERLNDAFTTILTSVGQESGLNTGTFLSLAGPGNRLHLTNLRFNTPDMESNMPTAVARDLHGDEIFMLRLNQKPRSGRRELILRVRHHMASPGEQNGSQKFTNLEIVYIAPVKEESEPWMLSQIGIRDVPSWIEEDLNRERGMDRGLVDPKRQVETGIVEEPSDHLIPTPLGLYAARIRTLSTMQSSEDFYICEITDGNFRRKSKPEVSSTLELPEGPTEPKQFMLVPGDDMHIIFETSNGLGEFVIPDKIDVFDARGKINWL